MRNKIQTNYLQKLISVNKITSFFGIEISSIYSIDLDDIDKQIADCEKYLQDSQEMVSSFDYSNSQQNNDFEDEYEFYLKPTSVDKNMEQYIKKTQQTQQLQQKQQVIQQQQNQIEQSPLQYTKKQSQTLKISQLKEDSQKQKTIEELQEVSNSEEYDQQAKEVLQNLKKRVNNTINNEQNEQQQQQTKQLQKSKKVQETKQLTRDELEAQKYTFKPQINSSQYPIKKRIRYDDYKTYYENQRQKRQEMYQKQLEKEMKECTYKPKINKQISIASGTQKQQLSQLELENKLMQRSLQKQQKENKMESTQAKYIEQQEEIRRKAYRDMLAQRYLERVNPDLALVPPEERLNYINKQKTEDDEDQYTFQPKINKSSELLATRKGQNILQRTQYYQTQKIKKMQELEDEMYPQQQHTVINQSTIDRLSKQKVRQQKIEKQPSFQPEINPISSKLTQNRISIFNDYDDYVEQSRKNKVQAQKQYEDKECTFKPKISQLAQHTQSIFDQRNINNLIQTINSKEQEKQQMIQYQQQQEIDQENREIQEEAKTFKSRPVNKKLFEPVYVNGYDKVIERKKKIDQIKEEEEQRKRQVYGEDIKSLEELNQQPFKEFQITRRQRIQNEQKLLNKNNKTAMSSLLDELLY